MLRIPLFAAAFGITSTLGVAQVPAPRTVTVHVRGPQHKSVAGTSVGLWHGATVRVTPTDAEGRAVLHVPSEWATHGDLEVGIYEWNRGREPDDELRLPVGAHATGDPPLQLEYPSTGRVRLILYDPSETPVAQLNSAHLQAKGGWFSGQLQCDKTDSMFFERVPLGLDLVARVRVDGVTGEVVFRGKGPQRPGELAILEGRLGAGPPVIALRVLDVDGHPVPSEPLDFVVVGNKRHKWIAATTDLAGRVRLAVGEECAGVHWSPAQIYVDRRGASGAYAGMAVVEHPAIDPGATDIGDVALVEPPVLVRGIVVDENGQPLAGVDVAAPHTVTQSTPQVRMGGLGLRGGYGFRHRVRTNAQGQFALRELKPVANSPIELRVSGHRSLVVEGPVQVRAGEHDVRIVARRTGQLEASFAGGPFHRAEMGLVMVRRGAPQGVRHHARLRGGTFRHDALPAGTYDIEFRATHMADPVRIEGVEVPADGPATDPRLVDIDWAPAYRLVRVHVTGPDGAALARTGNVYCHIYSESGNRSGDGVTTDQQGDAHFFAPLKRSKIAVEVEGHFHEIVPADRDDIAITLRRAPAVVATLAANTSLPGGTPWPDGMKLEFRLVHPLDDPWGSPSTRTLAPGQRRTLQPRLSGKQQLVLMLSSSSIPRDAANRRGLLLAWERYRRLFAVAVNIQPGTEPIPITVELTPAAIQRMEDAAHALGLIQEGR